MDEIFERESLIIGVEGVEKLQQCKVALFGVGGVGSFAAEALARAGVGTIALVDGDKVSVTNINRQLVALGSTVGREKVSVMTERIKDINDRINVISYCQFYSAENSDFVDLSEYDFIIDAIDSVPAKLHLIETAQESNTPIISCMGTGNRLDPTALKITDLFKTEGCPLARKMRYELKKRGIKHVPVVFSSEAPIRHSSIPDTVTTVGSVSFVPSCAGLIAAGYAIKELLAK